MNFRKILCLPLAAVFFLAGPAVAAEKDLIVAFHHSPGIAEENTLRELGGRIGRRLDLIKALQVKMPEKSLEELRQNPAVAYVQENGIVRLPEPGPMQFSAASVTAQAAVEYDQAWGVRRIGAKGFHDAGITGTGIKVAVLDTGVDYNHPELAHSFTELKGDDFITAAPDNKHDPMDDSTTSHGTHVAGIIAAALDGTGVVGVAPGVELYAVKVLDGGGIGDDTSVIAGLGWAVANGMNVVNISAAMTAPSAALEEACRAAYDAGILVVAAAGNGFGGPVQYPAFFDSVVAVSATDQSDAVIGASSVGPEVELAAPGGEVFSTTTGGNFGLLTGTSQASPHVAGAAALLLSAGPPDLNGDTLHDFRDVRLQLESLALDLGVSGRDPRFGFGLLQVGIFLTRQSSFPGLDARTWEMTDGIYDFIIRNDGLSALAVRVIKDGFLQHDQSRLVRFKRRGPGESILTLNAAAGQTLDVDFVPRGPKNSSALIEVQKR